MLKPSLILSATTLLMGCLQFQACAQDVAGTASAAPTATAPTAEPATAAATATDIVDAQVLGADGEAMGTVKLKQGPHGVLIRVVLNDGALEPGWHGLHLHQKGNCSDTGVFKLSGGHVGKVAGGHGLLNPEGPEGGDTPNIYAHTSGAAAMEIITHRITLADLTDEDGSALIIHAGPDDHITQPIGGAGARVGCAVIK